MGLASLNWHALRRGRNARAIASPLVPPPAAVACALTVLNLHLHCWFEVPFGVEPKREMRRLFTKPKVHKAVAAGARSPRGQGGRDADGAAAGRTRHVKSVNMSTQQQRPWMRCDKPERRGAAPGFASDISARGRNRRMVAHKHPPCIARHPRKTAAYGVKTIRPLRPVSTPLEWTGCLQGFNGDERRGPPSGYGAQRLKTAIGRENSRPRGVNRRVVVARRGEDGKPEPFKERGGLGEFPASAGLADVAGDNQTIR